MATEMIVDRKVKCEWCTDGVAFGVYSVKLSGSQTFVALCAACGFNLEHGSLVSFLHLSHPVKPETEDNLPPKAPLPDDYVAVFRYDRVDLLEVKIHTDRGFEAAMHQARYVRESIAPAVQEQVPTISPGQIEISLRPQWPQPEVAAPIGD